MSQPPSYAPTATTNYTIPTAGYHQEVTRGSLTPTNTHKDLYGLLAEIYSILSVLEMIENSYIKDYITDKQKYTTTSLRLINQYQIILGGFKEDGSKIELLTNLMSELSPDLSNFLQCFTDKFECSSALAIKRLNAGVPLTIEQASSDLETYSGSSTRNTSTPVNAVSQNAKLIAEATSNFITCMDALKLDYKTKDQLHPLLSELVINLNELSEENNKFDFSGKLKLITWLIKLNNLENELTEAEIEEFLTDLNSAYKNFYLTLD